MSVLVIKLVTDEDIISTVKEKGDQLILTNAARIVITQQGLALVPLSMYTKDKEVTIDKKFVIYTGTPDEEILNAYNSRFGSGLVVASSGSNILKV